MNEVVSMKVETNPLAHPAIFTATPLQVVHRLKIIQDCDAMNPRHEWDNLATMYCEHRRYDLGDKKAEDIRVYNERTEEKEFPKKGYTILPLYLYDHSGITISTGAFSCPWDSGQVGYIYLSDEKARKEFGWKIITKKRRDHIIKCLEGEVEVYDQYLTGDVYGFEYEQVLIDPEQDDDDEDAEVIEEGSCWGFFGSEPEENGIEDHLPVKVKDCLVTYQY